MIKAFQRQYRLVTAQLADDFCKFWLRQPSLFWQNFLGGFLLRNQLGLRTLSLKFHPKVSPATAVDTAPRLVLRQNLQKSSRNLGVALCHPPAHLGGGDLYTEF